MKRQIFVFWMFVALVVPNFALASDPEVKITAAERKMAAEITAKQLSDYLHFVASDAMGGRDTPSQGLDITAEFLAMNLRSWGFKPAGDNGTYFQKMRLSGKEINPDNVKVSIDGKDYKYEDDFFVQGGSGKASGDAVFVGNGWKVPSKGIDAYKGLDVKGKIVVIDADSFNGRGFNPPEGVTPEEIKADKDSNSPLEYAKNAGASAVILATPPRIQAAWGQLKRFFSGGRLSVDGLNGNPREGTAGAKESMPVILLSKPITDKLLEGTDGKATDLNKNVSIDAVATQKTNSTQNVVAIWEGSDPKLKEEMVAIGAHYDHVGTRENPTGDSIYNGADDDGSGTVAVLAIAQALAKAKVRPKRSVLFVWHAGEEKGLWGSEFFNKFPTVDISKVVAQLNIDMIGRSLNTSDEIVKCDAKTRKPCNEELSKPNEIYVIGSEMMSSTLGAITKETNDGYLKIQYNLKYDDPKDPNRFFFRSDHFNYALNGIPIVFWFDGVHLDYHQPGDEPDKIDYQKMEKVTQTIFLTLWEVAQLAERPKLDKQLPPELTRR